MKKIAIIVALVAVSFLIIALYQNIVFVDHKIHVVFCDVGQGDAIFVRTPQGADILVDGGPDESVLNCLSKNMPFWDRTIELVILTHPHADHLNGLTNVLKNYKIVSFATEKIKNNTEGFNYLMDLVKKEENIKINYLYSGDKFSLGDGVIIQILGPSRQFLETTSPQGTIGESSEFGSVVTYVRYKNFSALLTGDSQARGLEDALSDFPLSNISVFQTPHHGSKTGLNPNILDKLSPEYAVISVGKNKYGHPTPFTLDLLKSQNIKTLRTDQNGEVEVVSDGKTFKFQ